MSTTPSVLEAAIVRRALHQTRPTLRQCSWCHATFSVPHRPGRTRLYCAQACRQRAYEHRHGFTHRRTLRPLPGQDPLDAWTGTGYERGGHAILRSRAHGLRPAARPRGRLRETLCGLLVPAVSGQHFSIRHPKACTTCASVAARQPLAYGISPGNELARLRSVLTDLDEQRVEQRNVLEWINDELARRADYPDGMTVARVS